MQMKGAVSCAAMLLAVLYSLLGFAVLAVLVVVYGRACWGAAALGGIAIVCAWIWPIAAGYTLLAVLMPFMLWGVWRVFWPFSGL